jgi:hypothetical protein
MSFLEGHRTHIIAGAMAIINFVCVMGWFCFTPQQLIAIDGMLGAIALIFMRSSVAKVQDAVANVQDTVDQQ